MQPRASSFALRQTFKCPSSSPMLICIFAGWLWQRDSLLQELKKNDADAELRLFWKIWPIYVKWLCPVIIGVIVAQSVL